MLKINLLFERGRVDIEQDYRGISQIIESKNLKRQREEENA